MTLERHVEELELRVRELEKKAHRVRRENGFVAPAVAEVVEYAVAQGWDRIIDPAYFVARNDAIGWKSGQGRVPVVSWKAHYAAWVRAKQLGREET